MKIFNLSSLENIIIASPAKYNLDKDSFNYQSLIYICLQADNKYIGFYINKPLGIIDINSESRYHKVNVYLGGMQRIDTYFVLHSPEYYSNQTVKVNDNIFLTKQVNNLKEIVEKLNDDFIILNGYSIWSYEEINDKIKNQDWICISPDNRIIFNSNNDLKWHDAVSLSEENHLDYQSII